MTPMALLTLRFSQPPLWDGAGHRGGPKMLCAPVNETIQRRDHDHVPPDDHDVGAPTKGPKSES